MKRILRDRLELHETFCEILGNRNVYFQPPTSVKMSYPAIRYGRAKIQSNYANNQNYMKYTRYEVTLITKDPDNEFIEDILDLPLCGHDRSYQADNLNHDVFTIYV